MTDRELLEAAARAAGIGIVWPIYKPGAREVPILDSCVAHSGATAWDPLTDDGDALRLAVRLNLHVLRFETMTTVKQLGAVIVGFDERDDGDPCAATRRAIVRAAAAMAEQEQTR